MALPKSCTRMSVLAALVLPLLNDSVQGATKSHPRPACALGYNDPGSNKPASLVPAFTPAKLLKVPRSYAISLNLDVTTKYQFSSAALFDGVRLHLVMSVSKPNALPGPPYFDVPVLEVTDPIVPTWQYFFNAHALEDRADVAPRPNYRDLRHVRAVVRVDPSRHAAIINAINSNLRLTYVNATACTTLFFRKAGFNRYVALDPCPDHGP